MQKCKKILSLLLVLVLLLSYSMQASARVSLPSISSNKPISCYTLNSSGKVYAYTSSSLQKKTGGYIDCSTDECKIQKISGKAVQVQYPVSSGTRTAWFARSAFTGYDLANGAAEKWEQKGQVTTYKRSDGKETYGYISEGDICYKLSEKGNYKQVIYPVSGGYKIGWIQTNGASETSDLSYALYHSSKAYISCGFDGYVNTNGRHEGIDIKYKTGSTVYALTSGVVTGAKKGKTGRGGLSTLAVYNASDKKTVVYLHMTLSSVSVGDKIQVGQKIGTQSWRGISSSNAAHTHVEVRDGKKTAAAKSVDDYTLDNSNPENYWKSKGYEIK